MHRVRELPCVPRPGACGILDSRATAEWSPGMAQVHEAAECPLLVRGWRGPFDILAVLTHIHLHRWDHSAGAGKTNQRWELGRQALCFLQYPSSALYRQGLPLCSLKGGNAEPSPESQDRFWRGMQSSCSTFKLLSFHTPFYTYLNFHVAFLLTICIYS